MSSPEDATSKEMEEEDDDDELPMPPIFRTESEVGEHFIVTWKHTHT
tara:strand:+ start:118 stop:258 length:141 start_codon:yes stop_codon:yes gene_type:complete